MNPLSYPIKRLLSILLALLLPLLGLLSMGQAAFAQQPTISSLTVDSTELSNIRVTATFANLSKEVGIEDFVILEDGNVQQMTERSGTGPGGAQVALLIDIAQYPGVEPLVEQVKNAILATANPPPFQGAISTRDSFAAFAPGQDGTSLTAIMGWTPDYGDMVNNLYTNFQPAASPYTALKDLILQALDQFDPAIRNLKALIVFSDGIDTSSTTTEGIIKDKAQAMGVQIHTVLVGNEQAQNSANMQMLATVSGGQSINLASQSLETLAPFLAARKGEVRLAYSSQQLAPKTLQLQVTNNGETVSSPMSEFGIPAPEPLQLSILLPTEGESRELPEASEAVVPESECVFQPVSLKIREPDGSETRQLRQVEVRLRGPTNPYPSKTLTQPPWTEATICLEKMMAGTYLVEAELIDEFGLASEAEEVLLFLMAPPEPPPPPPTLLERLQDNALVLLTSLVALVALGVAIFALQRQPAVRRGTEILTGKVTEVFGGRRPSPAKASAPAKAKLTLVSNPMKNVPNVILIKRENTKIGRDRTVVDEVVKNQFISRLHCRIEEENGIFTLIDEGAASGTYINNEEDAIPINGKKLKDGDTIHLGPIQYYFELLKSELDSETEYFDESDEGDKTQPYVRHSPSHSSSAGAGPPPPRAEPLTDPEETEPYGMPNRPAEPGESAESTQAIEPEEVAPDPDVLEDGRIQITEKYDEMLHGRAEDVEVPVDMDKTEPYADKEG